MPKKTEMKTRKELKRLMRMSPHSPEGSYIRNWLDWMVDMPWAKRTESKVSIKKAEQVLDEDHYGLKKVKQRILEYLAVLKLKEKNGKKSKSNSQS